MAQTRVLLAARVRSRLAAVTDDMRLGDTDIYQCINDGLAAFAAERDWPWLEALATIATADGTSLYSMPTGCTRLNVLSVEGCILHEVQYRDILQNPNTAKARPQIYCTVGQQIKVAPTPFEVETIDVLYQKAETVLSNNTDTILCPDQYSDVAVAYACVNAAIRLRDQAVISEMRKDLDDKIKRIYDNVILTRLSPAVVTRRDTVE